jgi:hypothetical protein
MVCSLNLSAGVRALAKFLPRCRALTNGFVVNRLEELEEGSVTVDAAQREEEWLQSDESGGARNKERV